MRLLLDFGGGDGWVDYSAALVCSVPKDGVAAAVGLHLLREYGTYPRCTGVLDMASAGLPGPVAGSRVQVRSDAGAVLFSGVMAEAPQRVATVLPGVHVVRFEALEDVWLNNVALDTTLQPASAAVHAVSLEENAVRLHTDAHAADRASDVTVVGADEATTYVTELFQGDGTTAVFTLTEKPFAETGGSTLLEDAFAATQFRADVWRFVDSGSRLSLGAGGLKLSGGNGLDGQTYMAAQVAVEVGGTLMAEMRGVLLQPGSDGVLLGMYGGPVSRGNCFAGVRVKGTGGAQQMVALVNGAEQGTAVSFSAGHSYTLRLRMHCAEMQRVRASYQAVVNGKVQEWGGGTMDAPVQMVFEVLDEGLASSTPATVLYAGAVSTSIATAVFAPVNSVSLVGSVAHVLLKRQGSLWVRTTKADGTVVARRPGALDTGEDYAVRTSAISFFAGRVPDVGERVTVRYRLGERAVARMQDADAVAAVQQQGLPGLRQQVCRVVGPEPRSAADCAAAAEALLALYGSLALGVSGTCSFTNAFLSQDVVPGDRIALPLASGEAVEVPVVRVTVEDGHAVPEVLRYEVLFAQTAENGLSFGVSDTVPADAMQPAATYVASTAASMPELTVTVLSESFLQMDAGVSPPVGGGFEVRRHDGGWGPDAAGAVADAELVLRSPVRSFSVPRLAFAERFYVRMYDGAEVPVYSAESSLVVTHLPVS